jgi:peptidoglycan/xylan/chitin deacetylase (PgdA/CDA1 family)
MSLRSQARERTARLVRRSGLAAGLHRVHRRGHAVILFYHDPAPAVLDAHLQWLGRRFSYTTLDAVVDALHSGDWSAVPDGGLVLTFDDGHRGNRALLPVFRRHGVRPTIYLCSQVVGTQRRFWFQQPGWRDEAQRYKCLANAARLDALKRDIGFEPEREYAGERQALSREEILEMAPFVDFEVHTRFHPILPQCSAEEAWQEIAESKRELEALLGRACRHFSYPNGDYLDREVELSRRAGFASARTVDLGWVSRASDPFRLKCFGINDDASVDMMVAQLSGIPGWLRRLRSGELAGRHIVTRPAG